jgi:putative transposase
MISRQTTSSVQDVERSKILLAAMSGYSNTRIEEELGYSWERSKRWRYRWLEFQGILNEIESQGATKSGMRHELELSIRQCLSDMPRQGGVSKFTAEEYCQILGVSVEDPAESGRPISQWSLNELKDEVEKRGIVTSISRSHLGAFLKGKRDKTTQNRGLVEP